MPSGYFYTSFLVPLLKYFFTSVIIKMQVLHDPLTATVYFLCMIVNHPSTPTPK